MLGVRTSTALCALIYIKNGRLTDTTNNNFSDAAIMNFVQVDTKHVRLVWSQIQCLTAIPFVAGVAVTLLGLKFGISFLASLLVLSIVVIACLLANCYRRSAQTAVNKRKN